MNEFEFFEALNIVANRAQDSALAFITVFFAYVVTAHFVGRGLTRTAAVFVSTIYSAFLIAPLLGLLNSLQLTFSVQDQYVTLFPHGWMVPETDVRLFLVLISVLPLLGGWIGSLLYMHLYIRGKERSRRDV